LTAIDGYCGLLIAERFGVLTASQRNTLRRVQQSVERLSRMATDMFQLSLGEKSESAPVIEPGDIEVTIHQAIQESMPLAEAKKVQIGDDIAPPRGQVSFDAPQIARVLANLLENACRFAPRHSAIEVRGHSVFWERRHPQVRHAALRYPERRSMDSRMPNSYRVDIKDDGPGIPLEQIETIFEPYTSYAGGRDRAGAGLGLSICRVLINAHQGQIFAQSTPQGTTFSFLLPFAISARQPASSRSSSDVAPQERLPRTAEESA
jgi:signal transduction histidine kinase